MYNELVIGILSGAILSLITWILTRYYKRRKYFREFFKLIWVDPSTIRPNDVWEEDDQALLKFHQYYQPRREEETELVSRMSSSRHTIISGMTLRGKTRLAFECLKRLPPSYKLLIPRSKLPENIVIPKSSSNRQGSVILLDDLGKFANSPNFRQFIQRILKSGTVIATCKGDDLVRVQQETGTTLYNQFESIEPRRMTDQEGIAIATNVGMPFNRPFDGNPGSIIMELDRIEDVYRTLPDLPDIRKSILLSLTRLYYANLYDEDELFDGHWLKAVVEFQIGRSIGQDEWSSSLSSLSNHGFISRRDSAIRVEEGYLVNIFRIEDFRPLENLRSLKTLFADDKRANSLMNRILNLPITQFIRKTIAESCEELSRRANESLWPEVRSTALAGICLHELGKITPNLRTAMVEWLFEHDAFDQMETEPDEQKVQYSWGEELWDTGQALICLKKLGVTNDDQLEKVQYCLNWIGSMYNQSLRNNWNDEIWESAWSILAILETEEQELYAAAFDTANWISQYQWRDERFPSLIDSILTPHYTAYFLLIVDGLRKKRKELQELGKDVDKFNIAFDKGVGYLIRELHSPNVDKILWTGEGWSNGLILWSLAKPGRFPIDDPELLYRTINWFAKAKEKSGLWSDIEDSAYVVLGLSALQQQMESRLVV